MIVVVNTSPLTNLAAISQFDLLHQLYGQLHIAQGVWEELNAEGQRWPGRAAGGSPITLKTRLPSLPPKGV